MTSSLSALSLGSTTLSPTFAASKHEYNTTYAKASSAADTLTLSATASSGDTVRAYVDNVEIALTKSTNTYTGTVNIPAGTSGTVFVRVDLRTSGGPVVRYYLTVAYSYTSG